jgi:hypothetical protein
MAFFGEACVEVVAVIITFLCVSIINYGKRRSEATIKSLKKVSELEGDATMEEESLDSPSSESIKCCEEEEQEMREFSDIAERMAGRMAGLLQQLEEEEKEMREFDEVAERMAGPMAGLLQRLEEEEKEVREFNAVSERMAGRMAGVLQHLVEVDDDVDDAVVHRSGDEDIVHEEHGAKKLQWNHVAERMVALLERDVDVDASTECSAEASLSDDDSLSEEDMDSLEWDDVSFRMGRVFEKFAEDEHDGECEQVAKATFNESITGAVGPRCTSTYDVQALEILESYGVLGAPIGTWRSSRYC